MQTLDYSDSTEINELFVGRKIVSVDKDAETMVLDNGVEVRIVPNQGTCCASGDYFLEHIDTFDNAITNVEVTEEDNRNGTIYSIFVYAEGIATEGSTVATIEGDDGSGYYGTGFKLEITDVKA